MTGATSQPPELLAYIRGPSGGYLGEAAFQASGLGGDDWQVVAVMESST